MTFFKEGDNPQNGVPATQVYANTFGVRLANGQVTPCTTDGQKAEFVFNDTVTGVDTVDNGFGVGLMSHKHSGGIGVPVLAGGPISQGHGICVGMVDFVVDGVTVSLPVAIDEDDAEDGAWIVGKATMGSSADEQDDFGSPSIALETFDVPTQVVDGTSSFGTVTFQINFPAIAADTVTDWTPDFDGELVSFDLEVTAPATTAAKAATLNVEVNGVDVTGGVLALTSANATPAGKILSATPITAGGEFTAGQTVTVEGSGITAFAEGSGTIILTYKAKTV